MIEYSSTARQQISALRLHYEERERPEAIRNLIAAVEQAAARIAGAPDRGLHAPRPYPSLTRPGWRWLKAGPYWFAYVVVANGAVVAAVFHERADIPGRV